MGILRAGKGVVETLCWVLQVHMWLYGLTMMAALGVNTRPPDLYRPLATCMSSYLFYNPQVLQISGPHS